MKLFEHVKDNQFKLIIEGFPRISKIEENEDLQLIRSLLVPKSIKEYNWMSRTKWRGDQLDIDEYRKKLIKSRVENFQNGQQIDYFIKAPSTILTFRILKLTYKKILGDSLNKDVHQVGYYSFVNDRQGWIYYDIDRMDQYDFTDSDEI